MRLSNFSVGMTRYVYFHEWCWESLWSGSLAIKVAHAIVLLQIYSNGPVPWQPGKRRLWKEVNSLFMAVCFLHLRRMTNRGQGLYVNDLKNLSIFENPFIPILGSWWSQSGVVAGCHCPAWWSEVTQPWWVIVTRLRPHSDLLGQFRFNLDWYNMHHPSKLIFVLKAWCFSNSQSLISKFQPSSILKAIAFSFSFQGLNFVLSSTDLSGHSFVYDMLQPVTCNKVDIAHYRKWYAESHHCSFSNGRRCGWSLGNGSKFSGAERDATVWGWRPSWSRLGSASWGLILLCLSLSVLCFFYLQVVVLFIPTMLV